MQFNYMSTADYRKVLGVYLVLILGLSSIPGHAFPSVQLLSWDKLIHFIEYSILGFLAAKSINRINWSWMIIIFLGGVLFAGIDEFWQYFIPNRFSSRYDAIADIVGVAFGSGVTFLLISSKSD